MTAPCLIALEEFKIATGHHQTASLETLRAASNGMFSSYRWIEIADYQAAQSTYLDGAKNVKKIGLPSISWMFEYLWPPEYKFLIDTYTDNGFSGRVTIRTYVPDAEEIQPFNARLDMTDYRLNQRSAPQDLFENVRLDFFDLQGAL